MGKRIAIVQSSYIPWIGYFDMIGCVDEFVLFDDVQYTRRDWRNRNRIKTAQGVRWLTVPVTTRGRYHQSVEETEVASGDWAERHWRSIEGAYRSAPGFRIHAERVERLYHAAGGERLLSRVNHLALLELCRAVGIDTPLSWSRDYGGVGTKTERLLEICRAAGATEYLSGPSARAYIEAERFAEAGIALKYMDYSGYRPYPQQHGGFDLGVSILDLLFNLGHRASSYLRQAAAGPVTMVVAP